MGLTQAQVDQFHETGFLIVEDLLTPAEVEEMRARAEEIARGADSETGGVRRQVEPGVERGEQAASDYEASLRKMTSLALSGDPVFVAHARRPAIVECIQALLGPDLTLYGDHLFMKPPRVGSRQPYHQDQPAGFHIDPPEALITCWTALDESTEENGCLRYLPGTHRLGPLTREQRAEFETRALNGELSGDVPLILRPGGCGFHHAWILHASNVNLSDKRRRGYATHYVRSDVRYTGPQPMPEFLRVSGQSFSGTISDQT